MNLMDWGVVTIYMAGMVFMSWWLGRKQTDMESYYLGGNKLNWWSIGISTMATQCSTNSLLGAPAFIITVGLLWLQYEFALPFAMIVIMLFLLPFYRKLNLVSVYEYLEHRFGVGARTMLSVMFQLLRAFATGVTVYGISIVLQEIIGLPFIWSVIILGLITIIYDMLGGMEAVVWSDVIQMAVLYLGIILCVYYSIDAVGGLAAVFQLFPETGRTIAEYTGRANQFQGLTAVDFSGHGLGDGKTFGFLPMLLGGFFLYVSYYGTDQTQVQRELSSKDCDDTNMSLMLNGFLRFPLVLTYCFMGICIGAYIVENPGFLESLRTADGMEYNLAVPKFVLANLPHGIIGLVIVALFSAAMSSLDSTINSLSATSMKDIYERFFVKGRMGEKKQLFMSRVFTVFWGVVCVSFSFFVGGISDSIIESVNKIGSLANGPILAMFLLGILTRRGNQAGAITGLLGGFACNLSLWIFVPSVSWMWWNVIGCLVALGVGYAISLVTAPPPQDLHGLVYERGIEKEFQYKHNWPRYWAVLAGYGVFMVALCSFFNRLG